MKVQSKPLPQGARLKTNRLPQMRRRWVLSMSIYSTFSPLCPLPPLLYSSDPRSICDSRSVVLVSHGRMRTLDQQSVTQWRDWGQANGISVLLHNYPGYGKTPGPVTTARILADLELLVKFLERECTWREEQISLLGNSLGSPPCPYQVCNH